MRIETFENILNNPESDILDFKREQYDFFNNSNEINTAKFVKDIVSFCNTIRTETGYIILGVSITENGEKELIGIDKFVDDAIFQEKIKNKVTPVPYFSYSTIKFKDKIFGVFEFPVKKYEEPIFPTVKMKGLELGKVYYRRGSSNSEAVGREVILINKWLESLPSHSDSTSINDEVSEIMIKTTTKILPLSEQIASSLKLAKKYGLLKLQTFCEGELSGWINRNGKMDIENELSYRMQKVVMTPNDIKINPYSIYSFTPQQMLDELKKIDKDALEQILLFPQSITQIESYLTQFSTNKEKSLIVLTSDADNLFSNPKFKGITIKFFATFHNFEAIYQGIRQNLISNLLEI
ncbi:MAG: hypothetical protein FD170_3151 [Bacteroidetes bacterium]|nr:MAG: hypothetical protein FD170_3151 [Bacteroidota bacterium]